MNIGLQAEMEIDNIIREKTIVCVGFEHNTSALLN